MSQMKSSEMDEKLINRIISAAYNDAPFWERLHIMWKAKKDPGVKKLYLEYKAAAAMAHNFTEEPCPESVIRRVEKLTTGREDNSRSFLLDLYGVLFSKPAWPAAVIVVIISVISFSVYHRQNEQPRPYTKKEIALANEQASAALKMVGNILNETKSTVINEILPEKVSKPINKSFTVVRNLIDKENTNEKIN